MLYIEVSHHNARKEEDDGGDEKTRSVFAEEGKGADLSPGVVGTGARHRGAAGQRRDRRGEVSDRVATYTWYHSVVSIITLFPLQRLFHTLSK